MTYVVSFRRYRPGSRTDSNPWTSFEISESATEDGSYNLIDTVALDPVDADPENPAYRSFTTELGTLSDGWYLVTAVDGDGNRQDFEPVQRDATAEGIYYATPTEVRDHLGLSSEGLETSVILPHIRKAQREIDNACGGWMPRLDTGLKFATNEATALLDDDQAVLLSLATCYQVEYRMTMGEDFMVKEQYQSQSGPGYSTGGTLRKVCGAAYSELRKAGLLRLQGKTSNRNPLRYGEFPRIN